jgi:hypothetical protein
MLIAKELIKRVVIKASEKGMTVNPQEWMSQDTAELVGKCALKVFDLLH